MSSSVAFGSAVLGVAAKQDQISRTYQHSLRLAQRAQGLGGEARPPRLGREAYMLGGISSTPGTAAETLIYGSVTRSLAPF